MKKISRYLAALLVMAAAISFSACSFNEKDDDKTIIYSSVYLDNLYKDRVGTYKADSKWKTSDFELQYITLTYTDSTFELTTDSDSAKHKKSKSSLDTIKITEDKKTFEYKYTFNNLNTDINTITLDDGAGKYIVFKKQ